MYSKYTQTFQLVPWKAFQNSLSKPQSVLPTYRPKAQQNFHREVFKGFHFFQETPVQDDAFFTKSPEVLLSLQMNFL